MRRRVQVVIAGALPALPALLAFGAGCTFLISFEDVPRPDAGVVETSIPPTRNDGGPTSVDAGDTDGAPVDVPDICDDKFPLTQIKGCEGYQDNGQVCADVSSLQFQAGYDASVDVVTCSKNPTARAICIKHCRGPGGCAHNPTNIPDQCDQCAGKANGTHCGSEMAGWPSDTFRVLVTCTNDRMTKAMACPASCAANGAGMATCN